MSALTSLLKDDAEWSMPPYELWLQTHDDIVRWCLGPGIGCRDSRPIPPGANGLPRLATHPDERERDAGVRPVQAGSGRRMGAVVPAGRRARAGCLCGPR